MRALMHLKATLIVTLASLFTIYSLAQSNSVYKFGQITPQDFSINPPPTDSGANAIIIADVGSTDFEGNNNGDFTLIFKQYKRVLLKSRNAFDLATVKVPIYLGSSSHEELMDGFEASTYNLVDGKVVETKLDKAALIKEKYNRDMVIKKFTFPDLKEGCIIEYRYTIKSPYYSRLRSWYFQDKYPVIWSEYKVMIPPMFNYVVERKGVLPFTIDSFATKFKHYSIFLPGESYGPGQVFTVSGDAKFLMMAIKNVPAFKEESYTSSSSNYISSVKFQLHSIKYSDDHVVPVMKDWITTAKDLMQDESFGRDLFERNGWMEDELQKQIGNSTGLEKAKKIFEYFRDNFSCNNRDALYMDNILKKAFQTKAGNVAEINLLLTSALINNGFDAHPVILSTRDNGKVSNTMPILKQYNYVVSRLKIDSTYYLLDATVKKIGFGKLPDECYNDDGRIIDQMPYLISLSSDSLHESKMTNIIIVNDDKNRLTGSYIGNLGYYESLKLRDKLTKEKMDDYVRSLKKSFSNDVEISNVVIDSMNLYDEPVAINYDINLNWNDEDIIYFNPLFDQVLTKNPFVSTERRYPVEMPYVMDEIYNLNMEIPKGYMVEEMPKSTRVKLNETEGMFEYLLVKSTDNRIQMRCRLQLKKANYTPEDYETLRQFFAYVVKKESEQIVLKKIKQS
ncbi:MAG: DUF3858 domain-containing protein [Bacteroidota bacterium]|nr:DUF3858 domain-containing protein [Bacteroidota bacterium]